MRTRGLGIGVLAVALALAACSDDGSDSSSSSDGGDAAGGARTASEASSADASWLFVLTAVSGSASAADEGVVLTFRDVDDDVTDFTDRPARSVTTESVTEFVDRWDQRGFDDDPPNAALALEQAGSTADVFVVELSNPVLDGNTLAFDAVELGPDDGEVAGYDEEIDEGIPSDFGALSIFVDSAGSDSYGVELALTGPGNYSVQFTTPVADADFEANQVFAESIRWRTGQTSTLSIGATRVQESGDVTVDMAGPVVKGTVTQAPTGTVTMYIDGAIYDNIEVGKPFELKP
jgi:hypothetical protein